MQLCLSLLTLIFLTFHYSAHASAKFFNLDKAPELGKMASFKASALCDVAKETKHYITHTPEDKFAVHAGKVFDENVTLAQVEKTLEFICQTYREDVRAKRQSRLHDKRFLIDNFDFYRWTPDTAKYF